ncbi:hypothetical protein ACGFIR_10450 [Micromonospora sp. NPDC049051]|uniref:hypothetical protein n=1 Tax=Micromonospora sp. NPDC049051 TaxID=3364264 RepID=UPI0037195766
MSSPPVDPWSGQPEHEPHYDYPPPRPESYPAPPAGGWAPPPGGQPAYDGNWPTTPTPGPAPTQPYPHQPYGGYPAAPQAGFPTSPYAGYPPPAPHPGQPARSNQLVLTLSLVGLLVLCLGGGGITYLAYEGRDDPDPRPTPTVATTTPPATPSADPSSDAPSPTPSSAPRIRVVTPETLGGRAKSTEPALRKATDDMVRELRSSVSSESSVAGAFYGSAKDRDMVMVIAASSFVLNPERELDDTVKGLSKNLAVQRLTAIAPGPQGGVAKCGDGESAGVPLGVCAWADHGSVGLIVLFFSSSAAAAAEFVALRAEIEKEY